MPREDRYTRGNPTRAGIFPNQAVNAIDWGAVEGQTQQNIPMYHVAGDGIRTTGTALPNINTYTPTFNEATHFFNAGFDDGTQHRYADEFGDNEQTGVNTWRMPGSGHKKGIDIKVSKTAMEAIVNISNNLLREYNQKLHKIYKTKLAFLESEDYDNLYLTSDDDSVLRYLNAIKYSYDKLMSHETIDNNDNLYLSELAAKARNMYDIEYSKYKYYPRLKAKVVYGDANLLQEILNVTQIVRGKVTC